MYNNGYFYLWIKSKFGSVNFNWNRLFNFSRSLQTIILTSVKIFTSAGIRTHGLLITNVLLQPLDHVPFLYTTTEIFVTKSKVRWYYVEMVVYLEDSPHYTRQPYIQSHYILHLGTSRRHL